PFAHRAVIKGEIVVTELMHQEEVDGGRDAAAAIADDLLVFGRAVCLEDLARVIEGNEALGPGIDQACGRYVHAAGHPAGAAVSAGREAAMKWRAERVDGDAPLGADGRHCVLLVEERPPSRPRLKFGAR